MDINYFGSLPTEMLEAVVRKMRPVARQRFAATSSKHMAIVKDVERGQVAAMDALQHAIELLDTTDEEVAIPRAAALEYLRTPQMKLKTSYALQDLNWALRSNESAVNSWWGSNEPSYVTQFVQYIALLEEEEDLPFWTFPGNPFGVLLMETVIRFTRDNPLLLRWLLEMSFDNAIFRRGGNHSNVLEPAVVAYSVAIEGIDFRVYGVFCLTIEVFMREAYRQKNWGFARYIAYASIDNSEDDWADEEDSIVWPAVPEDAPKWAKDDITMLMPWRQKRLGRM